MNKQGLGTRKAYYTVTDVMHLLGVRKTKAYEIIKNITDRLKSSGELSEYYPTGLIPVTVFDEMERKEKCIKAVKRIKKQAADVLAIEKSIAATAETRTAEAARQAKDTAGRISRATEQGKRLYAMYTLAVNAGLRTIEISRANVKDIEVKDGNACLYIWGKGHTEPDAKKPLAPEVYAAVREYLNIRSERPTPNSPLFVSTGNRSGGQRIAETTISRMLKKAMQGAGFDSDRITAHTLRHTAGTNVMELTGDLFTAQKYMRHNSPATTEIYLHNDTTKQETVTAQNLYNLYHGISQDDSRQKLESLLNRLTPSKIEQLAGIAAAMA